MTKRRWVLAVSAATVVGLGALILLWQTSWDSTDSAVFEDLHLPPPIASPLHSHEEMVAFGQNSSALRAVDAQVSTAEAIARVLDVRGYEGDQTTTWLIRARIVGNERCNDLFCSGGGVSLQGETPVSACRTVMRIVFEAHPNTSIGGPLGGPLPDSECDIP